MEVSHDIAHVPVLYVTLKVVHERKPIKKPIKYQFGDPLTAHLTEKGSIAYSPENMQSFTDSTNLSEFFT